MIRHHSKADETKSNVEGLYALEGAKMLDFQREIGDGVMQSFQIFFVIRHSKEAKQILLHNSHTNLFILISAIILWQNLLNFGWKLVQILNIFKKPAAYRLGNTGVMCCVHVYSSIACDLRITNKA